MLDLVALSQVSVARSKIEAVTVLVDTSKENVPLLSQPSSRTHVYKPFVAKRGFKGTRAKAVKKEIEIKDEDLQDIVIEIDIPVEKQTPTSGKKRFSPSTLDFKAIKPPSEMPALIKEHIGIEIKQEGSKKIKTHNV